jgi:hypothetical protein
VSDLEADHWRTAWIVEKKRRQQKERGLAEARETRRLANLDAMRNAAQRDQARQELAEAREVLEWFASDEAWTVTPQYQEDGRYRFNTTPESIYATPWGFARAALAKPGEPE